MFHSISCSASAVLFALALGACAAGPRLSGAVTPQAGGNLQSIVKGTDRTAAMRNFDNDAKAYCGTPGAMPALDKPGKYVVIAQIVNEKKAEQIGTSGDKKIDVGVAVGLRKLGLEKEDSVEVTTLFKCQK